MVRRVFFAAGDKFIFNVCRKSFASSSKKKIVLTLNIKNDENSVVYTCLFLIIILIFTINKIIQFDNPIVSEISLLLPVRSRHVYRRTRDAIVVCIF